ncbi:MAG: hypothetical protein ACRDQW_12260, partial [Haloechinothrix sp.]
MSLESVMAALLRGLLIVGLLVSAAVHLERWFAGFRNITSTFGGQEYFIIGPLFLVNVVAGVVIAIAVLAWRHWLPLLAALGFGAGTLAAFFADRTVGLFGDPSPLVWRAPETVAAVAELLCIVCAGWLLLQ